MQSGVRLPYSSALKERARKLRNMSTPAEIQLWQQIKHKKIGADFNRQKIISCYIVDFYCIPHKLAIELDGSSHDLRDVKDTTRQQNLKILGVKMLRFRNEDVYENIDGVLAEIKRALCETPRPDRPPLLKEGNVRR